LVDAAQASRSEKSRFAAKRLADEAMRAAFTLGSVHAVSHVSSGAVDETFVQDIGLHEGQRSIARGEGNAEIRLTDDVVYIRGNRTGLAEYFGFPSTLATSFENRWVSATSADAPYAQIASGVTLNEALNTISLSGHLMSGPPETRDARRVIPISGTFSLSGRKGRATLCVSAGARPLPVEFVGSVGDTRVALTFSGWGSPVVVEAPTDATPFAELTSAR
jgi:hypothetical protein